MILYGYIIDIATGVRVVTSTRKLRGIPNEFTAGMWGVGISNLAHLCYTFVFFFSIEK